MRKERKGRVKIENRSKEEKIKTPERVNDQKEIENKTENIKWKKKIIEN